MAGSADRIAVVAGGIAGQSLCEKLRERDPDVGITLVCGEPHPPYDRVHLSDLLAGDAPEDPLGDLRLRPDEWYEDNGIELLVVAPVERVDLARRRVVLTCGVEREFYRLALATGSQPLVPPIPGIDLHTPARPDNQERTVTHGVHSGAGDTRGRLPRPERPR